MINDRGTIKWTSMMLPEHANMLKEMWSQKEWKEKPMLDEQLITEMNLKLQFALKDDLTIEIEYFKDHDYHKIKGKLLGVNPLLNYIKIEDMELPLDAITGVWID
ncbi:YolD-like family protein [Oceanobacillus luteolus]|uniref:YolD-like family protein n=1 Tax=Oceanobacillus luteolus TaxID=1274358 RepID=A0ABW4HMR5_9BACI|nr:YolD-like family protein [Oceanobacillus luteolus]MCM3741491.1 YolD-like family protein [Oceanobacillus luteolus]